MNFEWDEEGRLTKSAKTADPADASTFRYDARFRLASRVVTSSANPTGTFTGFVHDLADHIVAETDASGNTHFYYRTRSKSAAFWRVYLGRGHSDRGGGQRRHQPGAVVRPHRPSAPPRADDGCLGLPRLGRGLTFFLQRRAIMRKRCAVRLISSHRMGGRRYFDREQIERIRMVIALKKAGFGLSEISAGLLCSRGVSFDGVDVPRTIVWTKLENLRRKAGQIDAAIEAAKVLACKRNEVSESIKLLEEHLGDAVWSESGTRERVEVSRQQQ